MIVFATTAAHAYTHASVQKDLPIVRRIAYPALLSRRRLPRATYVFTDFDRLSVWQLEVLAHLHRSLREAGCRVLNDPARVLQRLGLLRRLHALGLNQFQAWPAAESLAVDRFPVFLRTASAHRGNLTDLLEGPAALAEALEAALQGGHPIHDLMIVEYKAEPLSGDVFRKLAMFRIGDQMAPEPSVHQRHWAAKLGEGGVAGEEGYRSDLEQVRTMPWAEAIRQRFEAGGIEYGRADFGLVGGRPQLYEINTNPMMDPLGWTHPFAERVEAARHARAIYLKAFAALDITPGGPPVSIPKTGPRRATPRGRGWSPAYLWTP